MIDYGENIGIAIFLCFVGVALWQIFFENTRL